MDHRGLSWNAAAEGPEAGVYDQVERNGAGRLPEVPPAEEPAEASTELRPATPLNRIRFAREEELALLPAPPVVDRGQMVQALNELLELDPRRTAVITVDCHRGHLDLAVATMPLAPQAAASIVSATAALLRMARGCGMNVIHVISQNRILPEGRPESMCNPFWAAVERSHQVLTPDRESTISRHNLVGTVQTQLMPELGPEPGDVVITGKRRLSIFRDTDLDLTLRELGVDTVVLAGVNTNTGVLCAAFEALNRDLRAVVVSDCVASMYGDDLDFFALQNVARCLGWVLTVEELAGKVQARRALVRA